MDEDVEADIVTTNAQSESDESSVDSFYEEAEANEDEYYEEKPVKRRGRPREKTIDKNKFIRYILVDILERLENIHNKSFQAEIKREALLIGKKIDELATILEIKMR